MARTESQPGQKSTLNPSVRMNKHSAPLTTGRRTAAATARPPMPQIAR